MWQVVFLLHMPPMTPPIILSLTLVGVGGIHFRDDNHVSEISAEKAQVFPNPLKSNSLLTVSSPEVIEQYEVISPEGRILKTEIINAAHFDVSINGYGEGLFLLKLHCKNSIQIRKIIVY